MSDLALVTGAPGWLGTRLVETLTQGLPDHPALTKGIFKRVRCLVLPGTDRPNIDDIEWVEGDLRDASSLAAFVRGASGATLFHLAGLIHPRLFVRDLFAVNATGTKNLLEAARTAGVKRIIYMSSNSPVGVDRAHGIFDEDSPRVPYLAYGESKRQAEDLVNAAGASGALETVIVRSPWFYGPGQPPRQALFLRMVKTGRVPLVGDGTNLRSMAYVDNICQGLLLGAITASANGKTYWIADRTPYAMNDILASIERALEAEGITVTHGRMRLPGITGDVAETIDRGLQAVGLYHSKMHVLGEMNKTIACSVARAEAELGYAPAVALEEGMRRTLRWMRDNAQSL